MSECLDDLIGKQCRVEARLECDRSNALYVALDDTLKFRDGDPLPLLHHWLNFWDVSPPVATGEDGHRAKGGLIPQMPLPRRMWAGGNIEFLAPLEFGQKVTRTSRITGIEPKQGRSGNLIFVTIVHELANNAGLAIIEKQTLVYREAAKGIQLLPKPVPVPTAVWHEEMQPDPVLLFRFSALTMNSHRIHYDQTYSTEHEGYPALVVQGPLQAMMLLRLAERHLEYPIRTFKFQGQSPAFDGLPLHVCGQPEGEGGTLWTQQGEEKSMIASVTCQKP